MIVHEHPIPERWTVGQSEYFGGLDVIVERRNTGAYFVILAGNVMDAGTGEFKSWRHVVAADYYPTLQEAFNAFKKFYQ